MQVYATMLTMEQKHAIFLSMHYRRIIKERRLPFQPESAMALDEQLIAAIRKRNMPKVRLECDSNGNIVVDRETHPEIFDWLVNG